ncbi:X-Pro dipeptidyl-peptidase [Steroidobacter agaridevorans]|uniref:X-Pro dipeptidyl-peptidase n=1 Tax=Steroidobacter agaridevorans TaxID=2695856 RepID=A0A829YGD0_9GAMM|nr:CocE/NonD family hydrolase [Steroidobacter agaridevorans]GFE82525.1 X-Pro dipeptidyl-peptidase [Steroidobacter agaridevorans]
MGAICYRVLRDVDIPMRDGARLKTDLWLPDVEHRVPVILYRTPYGKSNTSPDFLRPQHCVEAGFAAAVQDTRGRFASQGQWRPVMWDQEALDGYDCVEWLAAQDWCNGNVGMSGPSYLGISQLVCAALRPPHLKAIAPALTSTAEFDRIETGGAMRLDHIIGWVAFMALDWLQKCAAEGHAPTPQQTALVLAAVQDPRPLFDCRPLRDIPLFKLPGFPISFDALMSALAATENIDAGDIRIPVLHTGGWYDVFARSTVGMFRRQAAAGHPHSHLLMGCWTHAGTLPQYHGQLNFGVMASGAAARVHEQHLNFFRRHLFQEETKVPRVKYFLMGANTWHEADTWPPTGTSVRRLYLQGSQSHRELTVEAPRSRQSAATYVYDPADPTPACGGRTLYLGRLAMGPIDQAPLQRRADVLSYLGQPQSEALDIVGAATVQLHVSSTAPDTDFIVKLVDVSAEQVALPVCEGALRMRWRRGFSAPHSYVPGTVERISISLGDVAWRVLPGHRLSLQIQSASYPHLDPNMNTGGALGADASGVAATNSIHHDPERLSWLEISVATATA